MFKKENFVNNMTKLMYCSLIFLFSLSPQYSGTAQEVKEVAPPIKNRVIDSMDNEIKIKELANKQLDEIGKEKSRIIFENLDTLFYLKLKKKKKLSTAKRKVERKEKETKVIYRSIPLEVNVEDIPAFMAKYPNDTIPLKIEIERKPKKRNIFNIFKTKKQKSYDN